MDYQIRYYGYSSRLLALLSSKKTKLTTNDCKALIFFGTLTFKALEISISTRIYNYVETFWRTCVIEVRKYLILVENPIPFDDMRAFRNAIQPIQS